MIIQEFLPNPIGDDKIGEYILLFNDSSEPVLLAGWQIKDSAGAVFSLSGTMDAKKALNLSYVRTKVALNNNGERIFLYDGAGNLIDDLGYAGQAKEGQIINHLATSESAFGGGSEDSASLNPSDNSQFAGAVFINFLVAIFLAALGLCIILQFEKKLKVTLW